MLPTPQYWIIYFLELTANRSLPPVENFDYNADVHLAACCLST
ncbi:MAG: hypothetical protein V7L31_14305 [Nostoc sp.]